MPWPSNNSEILDFNCPAAPTPTFLLQMANGANTERNPRAGHFSSSHLHHRQGLSQSSPRLTDKYDQDMEPSRANGELFNSQEAFRVLETLPGASLPCAGLSCPLPGGCSAGVSLLQSHTHGEAGQEQALCWGPGTIRDGWKRILNCQRRGWAGLGGGGILTPPHYQQDGQQALSKVKPFTSCQHSPIATVHMRV